MMQEMPESIYKITAKGGLMLEQKRVTSTSRTSNNVPTLVISNKPVQDRVYLLYVTTFSEEA